MDIYLRLLAEQGDAALSRTEAAEHFADIAAHLDPEIIWRIVAENLNRRSACEQSDERLRATVKGPGRFEPTGTAPEVGAG